MKKTIYLFLFCLLVQSCATTEKLNQHSNLQNHVRFLASDELEGRMTGSAGCNKAAEFIADEFAEIGVLPFENYFQYFDAPTDFPSNGQPKNFEETQNVIGYISGKNKSDEFIVIGAHYDHLGFGGEGSGSRVDLLEIHNGADDNASGVAALLEIAKNLVKNQRNLSRSVMFVAFSAEEIGLIGSNYFVENCPIPTENIVAMLNMDMVGRMREKTLTIDGSGTSPSWDSLIENANHGFVIKKNPAGFGYSDHASFYKKNIPVLAFHTGSHDEYNTPDDDPETLNYPDLQLIAEMMKDIVVKLSHGERIEFQESGMKIEQAGKRPKFKVKFGIVPSHTFQGDGLQLDGVVDDGVAQKNGLQKGDIILQIGETEIHDIYDYMKALGKLDAGMTVEIRFVRDGEDKTHAIQFE